MKDQEPASTPRRRRKVDKPKIPAYARITPDGSPSGRREKRTNRPSDSKPDAAVEEALRAWRLAEARRLGVPAFRIFTDRALSGLVDLRPGTSSEMLCRPGHRAPHRREIRPRNLPHPSGLRKGRCRRCAMSMVSVRKEAMNVRPKFFHLETDDIPPNLCCPNIDTAAERPGAGVVGIGDGCGDATTEDFRKVELSFSRVRACNHSPQSSIPGTVEKTAFSQLVVAGILPQHRREDGLSHIVLNGVVAKLQGEAFAIAFKPLPKGGVRIGGLIDSRRKADEPEFNRIESLLSRQFEFLPGGERRQRGGIFHGQIVRQRPEDSIILRNFGRRIWLASGLAGVFCRFGRGLGKEPVELAETLRGLVVKPEASPALSVVPDN